MKLSTIIIDDEKSCRESLKSLLLKYCPEVDIVEMAHSVESGYDAIIRHKPRLIFLDVMMPPGDGFELLGKFKAFDFEVIFTTAYDTFALQAIKFAAIDYLLKPINLQELKTGVGKVLQKLAQKPEKNRAIIGRIVLNTKESLLFIDPLDIIRLESEGGHKTNIFFKAKKNITVAKDLIELEEQLKGYDFFRPHRSHIINTREINEYIPDKSGGCFIMSDGKMVPLASQKKDDFFAFFKMD